jgi:membrane-associated phospholipid phosphatase
MEQPASRETPVAAQGTRQPAERLWFGLFVAGLAFCLLSIWLFDEPIARFFGRHWRQYPLHSLRIGTSFVIAPIAAVLLALGIFRLRDKTVSKSGEALTVAAYSALSGFAINSFLLKVLFARERVDHFLHGHGGFFRAAHGEDYSFPSGHSVLVAAILVTLWRYYPRWYPLYIATMAVVTILLLAGNWHFLSDIIAGGLWGAAAAHVTALLWRRHASHTQI